MATTSQRIEREQHGWALAHGRGLAESRAGKGRKGSWSRLTATEKIDLLTGLERVFEGLYAHLPLKRARYGFDPVQRLRILKTQAAALSAEAFNVELSSILSGMRDFHTMYQRPVVGRNRIAALPFQIEAFFVRGRPHYVISNMGKAIRDPHFKPGVEVLDWNGVPIERAIKRHSEQEYSGRPDSALAAALDTFTLRPIAYYDLPDEDWVVVGYRAMDQAGKLYGRRREFKVNWGLIDPDVGTAEDSIASSAAATHVAARNPVAAEMKRAKRLLYAPYTLKGKSAQPSKIASGVGAQSEEIRPRHPKFLRAARLNGPGGRQYGYLRIYDFDVGDYDHAFVREVIRLIELLPQRGLIIDVRDNPGGNVVAAERTLQLFTPRSVQPVRFSVLATPLTRALCMTGGPESEFAPWRPSLDAAVRNGELYSASVPLTPIKDCNDIGQRYGGPVVLIGSATTYSAGDIFCAGFVDNQIGPFVCVGDSTGAGGANVWEYRWFREALRNSPFALPPLPDGSDLTVSFRRATRIGAALGTPIEDVGVPADIRYNMTYRDLISFNQDMLAFGIDILRGMPATRFDAHVTPSGRSVTIDATGLDRVEIRIDGGIARSASLATGAQHHIAVPVGAREVELCAYCRGKLRQRRLLRIGAVQG